MSTAPTQASMCRVCQCLATLAPFSHGVLLSSYFLKSGSFTWVNPMPIRDHIEKEMISYWSVCLYNDITEDKWRQLTVLPGPVTWGYQPIRNHSERLKQPIRFMYVMMSPSTCTLNPMKIRWMNRQTFLKMYQKVTPQAPTFWLSKTLSENLWGIWSQL